MIEKTEKLIQELNGYVETLCDGAGLSVVDGKEGFTPPAQPDVVGWVIKPSSCVEHCPGCEIPTSNFALCGLDFSNCNREQIFEVIKYRFLGAVIDLWDFLTKDIRRSNIEKYVAYEEEVPT